MYAAYSAAFSRMLSESTPGRETVTGPEPPLGRSVAMLIHLTFGEQRTVFDQQRFSEIWRRHIGKAPTFEPTEADA